MTRPSRNMIFGTVLLLAVVACIAAGVVLLGPPAEWRGRRLDERRINDLRELSYAIDEYFARHRTLPGSLEELALDAPWIAELGDPETGDSYGYRFVESDTYELCAEFAHEAATDQRADYLNRLIWNHPAGGHCFQLAVHTESHEIGR